MYTFSFFQNFKNEIFKLKCCWSILKGISFFMLITPFESYYTSKDLIKSRVKYLISIEEKNRRKGA